MDENELNALSRIIIGSAIEVHRYLGPGLLEHTYMTALLYELKMNGLKVESEVKIPIIYKGVFLDSTYRADIIVEDKIIVELKATEKDTPLFARQLNTYLRLSDKRLGLLINFNKERLVDGLTRVVNNL